jgi:DNA polymerase-3 subunit alpha
MSATRVLQRSAKADPGSAIAPVDLLWAWLREGWKYRVSQGWTGPARRGNQPYLDQINHEMELIIGKDYPSYFLLVSWIVRWAKDHDVAVGPGRGSSAASVVCFLLRITEPDPLDFPLTDFSRFVDPTREDLPDIDIDFDDEHRHRVRTAIVEKFGAAFVGNVGTFTKYKGKSALKDVQRVYREEHDFKGERRKGIPKYRIEELAGMIVERSGGDSRADAALMDTIDMFEGARAIFEEFPEIQQAVDLEGNYKSMSTHAAGVVVGDTPLSNLVALYTRVVKGREIAAVSVDKYDAEYVNLMKVDLLGLKTMGMLAQGLKIAGMTLEELYRIPLNDKATLEAFHRNDVIGVFQFEGRATRLVGRDLKPDDFLELVDVNALSRPGPLFSGTTAEYIKVKHGEMEPTRIHPVIDRIAAGTKGQIIYQEQILHALAEFGGLPVKRVHEIRRIISKKLGEAQFNTSARDFAENASRLHGVSEELAMTVWSRVVTSASYAFVYSHSLAYTQIGYWCMWLKVHHPIAFYTAQLRKIDKEKWPKLIRDAQDHGIEVTGVDIRTSGETWTPHVEERRITAGLLQMPQCGPAMAVKILAAREIGMRLRRADDLLAVKGIGPATLEKMRPMIESADPFGLLKTQLALDAVRAAIADRSIPLRRPTTNSDGILDLPGGREVYWVGMVKAKEYKDAIEDERARSGHGLDEIKAGMKRPDLAANCVLHAYDDAGEDVYVRINRFAFPKFKEQLERLRPNEDVIWVKAMKSRGGFGASIYVDKMVTIDPADDDEENEED